LSVGQLGLRAREHRDEAHVIELARDGIAADAGAGRTARGASATRTARTSAARTACTSAAGTARTSAARTARTSAARTARTSAARTARTSTTRTTAARATRTTATGATRTTATRTSAARTTTAAAIAASATATTTAATLGEEDEAVGVGISGCERGESMSVDGCGRHCNGDHHGDRRRDTEDQAHEAGRPRHQSVQQQPPCLPYPFDTQPARRQAMT
jgi:hypothetical protein